jgi:prepilin-type processing-associated H-X9-DG protein
MTRRAFTVVEFIVVVLIILGLLACLGAPGFPELVLRICFGWISFLWRVGPQIEVDWGSALIGGVCLAAFTGGLHGFLRWFYGAIPRSSETRRRVWHWRWTVGAVAIIVMLFVAGISMVGITHQLAWLATAKEPLMSSDMGAARRSISSNNLRQIEIATRCFHEATQAFPPGMRLSPEGEALHGWQTILLAQMDWRNLHDAIDWQKPWTDPHHQDVFKNRISQYQMPSAGLPQEDDHGYSLSHYSANVHVIGGTVRRTAASITDGASNTILAGEAAGNYKPWGHPRNWRDPALGINASSNGFGSPWKGGANMAMADGSVRFIHNDIDPGVLRALATPAGGEPMPP